jgi:putative exonuclease with a BRCT domain|nr:MAG TPA: DNA polymerase III subunit alpha [Caudoviricetes sp.]
MNDNTFIAIDFETANSAYYSACSLGIVVVTDREIVKTEQFMIQPPDNIYNASNVSIHHIVPNDTKNADTFPDVWNKIKQYFDGTYYIVAHNANFDMSVLKASLDYYHLDIPDFEYFCSIQASKPMEEGAFGRSLEARCEYYKIALDNHHDSLCDAIACAQLVICGLNNYRYRTIGTHVRMRRLLHDFSDVKLKLSFNGSGFQTVKSSDLTQTIEVLPENEDFDFKGKTFAFTGNIPDMPRDIAYAKVIAGGGVVADGVSKKVDILVNADGRESWKTKKAKELQGKGHRIKIITSDEFIEMLNN